MPLNHLNSSMSVLLLFNLLLSPIFSTTCTHGCLSCEKIGFEDPKCTMCDSVNNFIMINGQCIRSEIHGCSLLTFYGKCLSCVYEHYLDPIRGDCHKIPQSNAIANCLIYKSLNSCMVCEADYYISPEKICLPVKTSIENCEFYQSETKCMRCKENFWISYEQDTCFPIDGDNCMIANSLRCGYCQDKYFQNQNYAVTNLSQSHAQILMANYLSFDLIPHLAIQQSACVRQIDENCQEFLDATNCKKCNAGYFLYDEDNRCYEKPHTSIPNCQFYATMTTCSECEDGYYLEAPGKCTQNEVLPSCINYENNKTSTFCKLCESEYYVNSSTGECSIRVKSKEITFCTKYSDILDQCIECVYGYQLTGDNLKCLKELSFCEEYEPSNEETSKFTCYRCSEGYYLDESTGNCVQPSDYFSSRCQFYKRNSSQCEHCSKNTFVESVTTCQPHDQDVVTPSCLTTSLISRNTCDVCEEGYLLFPADSNCLPLESVIENCQVYQDDENCSECLIGYHGTKCERIDADLHCLKLHTDGKCLECERDYYLDLDSDYQERCLRPPAILENYCDDIELDMGVFSCNQCKENMLSMNYKFSSYCDVPPVPIPEFCIKMGIRDAGSYECINCEPGYYLKDKTCVRQCNFDNYVIQMQRLDFITEGFTSKLVNYGERRCIQSVDDLCLVKTYSATNTSKALKEVCARCKENASSVIDDTNFNFSHFLNVEYTIAADNHSMTRSPAVDCVENQTLFAAVHEGTVKESCRYFLKNGSEYVCQRCINGYSGPLKHVVTLASGITDCTQQIQYCNSEVSFKGANYKGEIGITLESIFSCSSCEGDRIPFIHVQRVSPGKLNNKSYDFTKEGDYIFYEGVDPKSDAVVCRNPNDPTDLGLTTPNTSFVRPCGLAMINVMASRTSDEYLECLACPPGFKATYDTTNKEFITSCTKIENCDTSYGFQWFNACSKCTGGFLYEFNDTNNVINFDKCIQKNSKLHKNCIASVDEGKCFVCESGYSLNEDQICELISAFDCLDNFTNNDYQEGTFGTSNDQYDFTLPLVYNFDGKGCSKCMTSTNVAIEVGSTNHYYCTPRSYIAFNDFAENSPFVDNCLKYMGGTDTFTCIKCREQFIITASTSIFSSGLNYGECIDFNSDLNFCEIANANNHSNCKICKEGYFLTDTYKCQIESVSNCIESLIYLGVNLGCRVCAEGYFKNISNDCIKGNISDCKTYSGNVDNCIECFEGFHIFQDAGSRKYCIEMQDSRCKKWSQSAAGNNKYDCEICEDGFSPNTNKSNPNFRPNMCFGPVNIDNCLEYNIDQAAASSSNFTCKTCDDGYYVNAGGCTKRQNLSVNCEKYNNSQDECEKCYKEYVISDDSQDCLTNPTGVDHCSGYEDLSTCKFCDKDYFVVDNVCVNVAIENVQTHCIQYKTETHCEVCASGNYLDTDGKCKASEALNCLEFKNLDECTSCIDNYFIKSIPNPKVDSRATIDVCELEQTVPNCEIQTKRLNVDNEYDYFCLQCNENFYLSESGCTAVPSLITDCMYYSSSTDCLYCIPGKVTSEDKKQCINSVYIIEHGNDVDYNCKQNRISKAPICNFCKEGYIHIKNECVKCEIEEDCYTCDPNDLTRCMICKPGHYMTPDRKCLETILKEDSHGHDEEHGEKEETHAEDGHHDENEDTDHVFAERIKIGLLVLMVVLML